MIYRRATTEDVQGSALRNLIWKGLHSAGPFPVDEEKLFTTVELLTAGYNYSAVAMKDGQYVGYIGGQVSEHPWLPRSVLNVVGWYSVENGCGWKLLRMCMRWAAVQPVIKSVMITVNPEFVERVGRILRRRYGVQVITTFQIGV